MNNLRGCSQGPHERQGWPGLGLWHSRKRGYPETRWYHLQTRWWLDGKRKRYSGSCFSFWSRQMNCRRPGVLVHLSCYTGLTQTRWLINNRNVFLTILEAGNSKIKAPADAVSDRYQRTAISSLCLHMVEANRQRALWVCFFFIRALNPFIRAPSSWLKHLQKDPAPNGSTLGKTFQYMNFGGDKHSV